MAIALALDPNSFVFNIVSYAWAGFGAAFGPIIIMALFWKRANLQGALAGIIVGGLTVLIWKQFAFFGIYEIVPGFFLSFAAIYFVSKYTAPPDESIVRIFEETEKELLDSKN